MSEQLAPAPTQAQLQEQRIHTYEQITYANGAQHVYESDLNGKLTHTSHDAVLQSYGYSKEDLPNKTNETLRSPEQEKIEKSVLLGRFALAKSHILDGGDADSMPDVRYWNIEGARQEIQTQASTKEYVSKYTDANLDLVDELRKAGMNDMADQVTNDLVYQISGDGLFANAIESGTFTNEQLYKLVSQASEVTNGSVETYLNWITKQKAYEYRVPADSTELKEIVSTEMLIDTALADSDEQRKTKVLHTMASLLARGIQREDRSANLENERLIGKILTNTSGLNEQQVQNILDACTQSKNPEQYGIETGDRVDGVMNVLTALKEAAPDTRTFESQVATLYSRFGVRHFYRYSPQVLARQLQNDFVPDEVIVTAAYDTGKALSKPENSASGVNYTNAVYFEAGDSLGIAKALITANKMSGKPLDRIMIRAHGGADGFLLSKTENSFYGQVSVEQIDARMGKDGWEEAIVKKGIVDKNAELIFESCSLGAGGFPKSLYERTGVEALTSPKNITGSAIEGAPGVMRNNGKIQFGIGVPNNGVRKPDEIVDYVSIEK